MRNTGSDLRLESDVKNVFISNESSNVEILRERMFTTNGNMNLEIQRPRFFCTEADLRVEVSYPPEDAFVAIL